MNGKNAKYISEVRLVLHQCHIFSVCIIITLAHVANNFQDFFFLANYIQECRLIDWHVVFSRPVGMGELRIHYCTERASVQL